jgi:hypothetical protein
MSPAAAVAIYSGSPRIDSSQGIVSEEEMAEELEKLITSKA